MKEVQSLNLILKQMIIINFLYILYMIIKQLLDTLYSNNSPYLS